MHRNTKNDLIESLRKDWAAERPELDTSAMDIVGRVIHLADRWQAEANHALVQDGISYTEFDIIATLRRSGPPYELTPTELRQSVLLTSGAMTAALKRIESKNLIERRVKPKDGRTSTARLTLKGKNLALNTAKTRFTLANKQVANLSENEMKNLTKILLNLLGDKKYP